MNKTATLALLISSLALACSGNVERAPSAEPALVDLSGLANERGCFAVVRLTDGHCHVYLPAAVAEVDEDSEIRDVPCDTWTCEP